MSTVEHFRKKGKSVYIYKYESIHKRGKVRHCYLLYVGKIMPDGSVMKKGKIVREPDEKYIKVLKKKMTDKPTS
jgi:hypothetical protein